LPVIAVVVGGFFFVRYIRSLQAGASSVVAAGPDAPAGSTAEDALAQEPPPQDDYRARIESELREK
jgi:hypothetical protein